MPFFYRSHTEKILKTGDSSKIYHAGIYAPPTQFIIDTIQCILTCLTNIFFKNQKAIGETDISKRRAFSSVSFSGSLTVEAALVLPVFLGAILMLTGVFQVMTVYEEVNSYLCTTGRKLAAYSEANDGIESTDLYKLFYADMKNSGINSEHIVGGSAGLMPVMTKEAELIKIKITYAVKVQGYFRQSGKVILNDWVYVYPWLGAPSGAVGDTVGSDKNGSVYVAENGGVYHKDENCSYLALSIHQCGLQDVGHLRNEYGAKYVQCERCGKYASGNETIYITDSGRAWHSDRQCSGLKRELHTMTQDEADKKGLRPCSRCGYH